MMEIRNTLIGSLFLAVCLQIGQCEKQLPDSIVQEIANHKDDVTKIIQYMRGAGKHEAHRRLAYMTDTWGARGTGSQALRDAIDFAYNSSNSQGLDNVRKESVTADYWERNEESLRMVAPRTKSMALLSLGSSVGTGGLMEGQVIVVNSFDQMDQMATEEASTFQDKVVLYNMEWTGYSTTVPYRSTGASRAGKWGAKAVLLRSVADFGIYTPHTGQQVYNTTLSPIKIPVAAITIEDAELLNRMYDRGDEIRIELNMACENHPPTQTHNVVLDVTGSSKPEELVIIGGHIDSWDVGNGVMDDGGGVMISWQALLNLKALELIPKRTVRAVFWTAEEIGLVGAHQYYEAHKEEYLNQISLIMESDYGTFKPFGIGFTGTASARAILEEILRLLAPINATGVDKSGGSPDTGDWMAAGVPAANLWTANDNYFFYHHTEGDSITMEDPDDLDLCVIVWTVVSYVVANMEDKLPRTEIYPDGVSSTTIITSHVNLVIIMVVIQLFTRLGC